jgi:hypothetical protein
MERSGEPLVADQIREKSLLLRLDLRVVWPVIGGLGIWTFVHSFTSLLDGKPIPWLASIQLLAITVPYLLLFALAWRYTNPILVTSEGMIFRKLFGMKRYIAWRNIVGVTGDGSSWSFVTFVFSVPKMPSAKIHISYFQDPEFTKFVRENKVKLPLGLVEVLSKAEGKAPVVKQQLPSTEDQ